MKISTKGRYALRIMADLGANDEGGYISVKDIAERQNISDKYLEQIISVLSKAGFVSSLRGAGGGYRLNRPPEEYTVGMILRQTEGSLAPVNCLRDDEPACTRSGSCCTELIWQRVYEAINDVIDNITLAELVEREKQFSRK